MWKLSSEERLSKWRDFRKTLDSQTLEDAIQNSYELWKKCPFSPYYLDIATPNNWPTPWQLLIDNYYCDIAKCLGIIYTVYLTKHLNACEPELRQYVDTETKTIYTVASFCDGKYIANFSDDDLVSASDIPTTFTLIKSLNSNDLNLSSLN